MFSSKRSRVPEYMIVFALLAAMFCTMIPGRALAAAAFSDVPQNAYYSQAVKELSDSGTVNGYSDGTFRPSKSVTNAEALTLVCSMAGIAYKGYTKVTSPWYSDVVTWSEVNDVAPKGLAPDAAATREQICGYIVSAYRMDTSKTTSNAFADTASKTANTLYDAGVIKGIPTADGRVNFGGGQNVKRCDVCIMLMQLRDKAAKPDWSVQTAYTLDMRHYVFPAVTTASTFEGLVKALGYCFIHAPGEFKITIRPQSAINDLSATIRNAMKYARVDYYEYYSAGIAASYSCSASSVPKGGSASILFYITGYDYGTGESLSADTMRSNSRDFEYACWKDVAGLYDSGALKTSMSAREKADVLCSFVHRHMKYDYNYVKYSGYCAAVEGCSVCEGYTAFYNYLCNIAGVPMEAATDNRVMNHAWSRVYIDGAYYNVDTTFCDQDDESSYNYMHGYYFWVTDTQLAAADKALNGEARANDLDGVPYAFT